MVTRRGIDAVNWAAHQVQDPDQNWQGYCLKFVRRCFNVGAKFESAEEAWYATDRRRGTSTAPPLGVPVYWTNGGYGHITISAGGGYCYSNDIKRRGKIDRVSIAYITRHWGQTYRGWTEDVNGVQVYNLAPPPVKAGADYVVPVPRDAYGRKVMSYQALIVAGKDRSMAETDRFYAYRQSAMSSLKVLGFASPGAPDTDFPEAWITMERAIHRATPNHVPDPYSFEWFVDRCGFWWPDGSAASLGIPNDWPPEAMDR